MPKYITKDDKVKSNLIIASISDGGSNKYKTLTNSFKNEEKNQIIVWHCYYAVSENTVSFDFKKSSENLEILS